jgi:hypothetical protein
MAVTYFWNVALRQALYGPLGDVEVAIRNGVHRALSIRFGHEDWYDRPNVLHTREQRDIAKAKRAILDAGKAVIPGRVIAAVPFGFWTSLLDTAYGERPHGPQLWTTTNGQLATVFPHATPYYQGYRGRVFIRVDMLRRLRNRVFHHEPVWNGVLIPARRKHQPAQVISLTDAYTQLIETIGWVNPTLQATTSQLGSFRDVLNTGYDVVDSKIRDYLNMPRAT